MDLNLYKQCVEFRKLNSKHWSDDCVICYMKIIPSQNIGFACHFLQTVLKNWIISSCELQSFYCWMSPTKRCKNLLCELKKRSRRLDKLNVLHWKRFEMAGSFTFSRRKRKVIVRRFRQTHITVQCSLQA